MVIDFGYDPKNAGYIGGWLTSTYFMAQFVTNIVLGSLSDVRGRRKILLLGMAGNTITSLFFGFSKRLWMAVMARALSGLLNGNIGVLKSYIREITDDTNQSTVYSYRSIGFAIGTILGPLGGGALARPIQQYPDWFENRGVLSMFPYILPCIVASIICLIAFTISYLYLEETVDINRYKFTEEESESIELENLDEDVELEDQEQVIDLNEKPNTNNRPLTFKGALKKLFKDFLVAMRDKNVFITIFLYALLSFNWLCFDEVFSFWSIRNISDGGIDFSTLNIGVAQSISGVGMILIQMFIYVPMDKKFGSLKMFIMSSLLLFPVFLYTPYLNLVAHNRVALWFCISIIMIFKSGLGTSGMAAINLLINNSATSQVVGSVNGMSASVASLSRIVAPVVGGSLYAWTNSNNLGFPLDFHLPFFMMATITLIISSISLVLNSDVNTRRKT